MGVLVTVVTGDETGNMTGDETGVAVGDVVGVGTALTEE